MHGAGQRWHERPAMIPQITVANLVSPCRAVESGVKTNVNSQSLAHVESAPFFTE